MARDYLAIQGSATPSERAFSSGGTTGTVKRNRLNVNVFESLQLLKSAYRNGHVGAQLEAEKHTISLSDIFGTNGDVTLSSSWKGKGRETELD
jgi:hAT family C-terminal dimerisation region